MQGIFTNPVYYGIWFLTMALQILIVQFGGMWMATAGLTIDQWMWCILLGFTELLWGQV